MGIILDYIFKKKKEEFDRKHERRLRRCVLPRGVMKIGNIGYGKNDRNTLDIYRPDHIMEALPIIVSVHGGGLFCGDKSYNTEFCAKLAKMGYLVFSLNYRLIPNTNFAGQLQDVSRGMDFALENGKAFGGDLSNVYMVGDSAGALLVMYAIAGQKNSRMANTYNFRPSKLKVNAVSFISGMLYTTKFDEVGLLLSRSLYGKNYRRRGIFKYTDPGHYAVAGSMPPVYLLTGEHDSFKKYSVDFSNALKREGKTYDGKIFGGKEYLGHNFIVEYPGYEESVRAMNLMHEFFNRYRKVGACNEKCG